MSIDLKKLENKLNEALIKETTETLTKFLTNKRMSNKNMTHKELVKEDSISISFVNGQITDIRGTGYVPSDITDDFTGTLIYKNNELSKVIGFGHLGKSTNNNTHITTTQ